MALYDKNKWIPSEYKNTNFRYVISSGGKLIIVEPTKPDDFVAQKKVLKSFGKYDYEKTYLKEYAGIENCYIEVQSDYYDYEDLCINLCVDEMVPNPHYAIQKAEYDKQMTKFNKELKIYEVIAPLFATYYKNKKAIAAAEAKNKKIAAEENAKEFRRQQFIKLRAEFDNSFNT